VQTSCQVAARDDERANTFILRVEARMRDAGDAARV
jgi:hypothetical protein